MALLEQAACQVSEWAGRSSVRLNAAMTKAIIFGLLRYVNEVYSLPDLQISLGDGMYVPFSNTVRSFGVVLDCKLSWRSDIVQVAKKFNRVLYSFRFFRQYTTEALRTMVSNA